MGAGGGRAFDFLGPIAPLVCSILLDLEIAGLGDDLFDGGNLGLAFVGVCGTEGEVLLGLLVDVSSAVNVGGGGFSLLLVPVFVGSTDLAPGLADCAAAERAESVIWGFVVEAAFDGRESSAFPFVRPLARPLVGVLENFDGLAFGSGFGVASLLTFSISLASKGDPFSIDPNSAFPFPKAPPPETACASFGSAGSMVAVESSAVETALSGLVSDGPSTAPGCVAEGEVSLALFSRLDSLIEVCCAIE